VSLRTDLTERLRALFFRRRAEQELDEELQSHLEFEVAARIRAGVAPSEARRQALVAFGGMERWKEETRAARGLEHLEGMVLDLRHAARSLRRNPGFTAAGILVFGLGLGAATAVFGVVRTVLLSPLPYPHADRLVRIYQKNSPLNLFALSTVDVQAIALQQRSFEAFGVLQRSEAALSGIGSPERVLIGRGTAGFFQTLGLTVATGRLIGPEDELPSAAAVTVVSHALAERALGGAGHAVGRSITLDGVSHVVVGVLPPGVDELAGVRGVAWTALQLRPPARRGPFWLRGIARLRAGVTLASAAEDLEGISQRIFPLWAGSFRDPVARLTPVPLRDTIVGDASRGLRLFAAAIGLVLLTAVANVATLVLVRSSAREQELAVRAALGASRQRLARLLLTENLVLTLAAGVVGLATAWVVLHLLRGLAPGLPRVAEVALDGRAVVFAVVVVLVAGPLMSLSPISALLARDGRGARLSGSRAGPGRRTNRVRALLVVAEFALALPLLLGAGLLLNSFLRLSRVDPGFDPTGVVTLDLALPRARYPDDSAVQRFWSQAETRGSEIPGIRAVGLTSAVPPDDPGDINNFDLLDRPVQQGESEPVAPWAAVTPGYFAALGVPLLEGRLFQAGDSGAAAPVVVVSRAWAARYYPGQRAVGRQMYSGGCRTCPPSTVIGVVGDVKYVGLAGSAEAVYEPVRQGSARRLTLVVRGSARSEGSYRALTAGVATLDPELPLAPAALADRLRASLAAPGRWTAVLIGFALAAASLAALGVYGLMSYVVRQRRREIGVRLALGAEPTRITRMIMARGMRHAALGTVLGLGLARLGTPRLGAVLYQVDPWDSLTVFVVGGLLLAAALVSCWLPGRRAARVRLPEALSAE
jgi:putative ABC transport system permease protein